MNYFRKHGLLILVGLLLLTNLFIWQSVLASGGNDDQTLKVFYLDIGQGDATLIEVPNGNQVLIDGGRTDNKVLSELGEVMPITDKSLDVIIATHPDADHVGGLPEVLSRYDVGLYLESGNETKDTQVIKTLEQTLEEKNINRLLAKKGQRLILDEEKQIYLDILYPDRDVSKVESNDASIIAKLTYGETCFIF
ncbi:MAG: MBL fold metallo-hydrolase, partial [bacterium]|nr:MBL fold metallo-hydrolase [bacterium]